MRRHILDLFHSWIHHLNLYNLRLDSYSIEQVTNGLTDEELLDRLSSLFEVPSDESVAVVNYKPGLKVLSAYYALADSINSLTDTPVDIGRVMSYWINIPLGDFIEEMEKRVEAICRNS